MRGWWFQTARRRWLLLLTVLALAGYWLLPISGQVVVIPGERSVALPWPRFQIAPTAVEPGRTVTVEVADIVPWGHVLLTLNGHSAGRERRGQVPGGPWTWHWTVTLTRDMLASNEPEIVVAFYRDCDTGCIRRGQVAVGGQLPRAETGLPRLPTKLGVVFADPNRDWHGRQGWDVELTYARLADSEAAEDQQWQVDQLAARVFRAARRRLRVLIRVDYDRGQSLPAAGDQVALDGYLRYLRRLARDERLQPVYGYVIGSGYNALDSNAQAPGQAVTPAWYARLFNGYGEPASRMDNVAQTVKEENVLARVLVGPVRPWNRDQRGDGPGYPDAPWLSYFESLVAALDEGARVKAAAGIPLAAPDGFALHSPGRPELALRLGKDGAEEPRLSLPQAEAGNAQGGFRVYQDYLAIINRYATTRGLPAYITSTSTFVGDEGVPPAQNYPRGWLTAALTVVNDDPQVAALCWFIDGPLGDRQWAFFSLSRPSGRLIDAAEEFESLLRRAREEP